MKFAAALFAALGLAASAPVANAQPRAGIRVQIRHERYDRFERSHWHNEGGPRWVQISGAYSANVPTQEVDMMGSGGRFNLVRIEGVSGAPVIGRVTIQFMNNESQVVDLNARLIPGTGEVIDLTGNDRKIKRVMVYPLRGSRGTYAVYGG